MSRPAVVRWFAVLLVLALTIPAITASARVKEEKSTLKATLTLSSPVTLAGKQIKPGDYRVVADESKVTLSQAGKVVAEAPIEWTDGTNKFRQSAFILQDSDIREIRFGGKTRYVVIRSN